MNAPAHEGKEVEFMLDGLQVEGRAGETVLSVARRRRVSIPTLCHHEAVSPSGACRLCVVEVFWGKRSKIVTSCIYTPYENDRVETNNDRVRSVRRFVLELLAARCPSAHQIRELALEYGVDAPRYETDDNGKSETIRDPLRERCILCGLCVRVCDEVVGQHAIAFAGRGMERRVTSPFAEQAEECIGCAACVFICPTGALHFEDVDGRRVMKELHTTVLLVACRDCGLPYATEKQIEKVKSRLKLSDEAAALCPSCRVRAFGGRVEQILAKDRKATFPWEQGASFTLTSPEAAFRR